MYLLIDGKNLVYRAFFGMPELTRGSDGFPTNALYGWVKALWKLSDQFPAATLEVFWDAGSAARSALDPDYKAQRKPAPEPMKRQLPVIEKLTNLMGIPSWKEQGMEADDLLSSRALGLADGGEEVVIVSADKDFSQLVNDKITILNPPPTVNPRADWRRLDAAGVVEKFGVTPAQMADYLALVGDTSDNIAGLDGVGPKTAAEWLKSYHDLEGIIANCGKLSPKRFQNIVYTSVELLYKNRAMTILKRRELPPALRTAGTLDAAAFVAELDVYEMKSTSTEAQKRYGVIA